MRRRQSRGGATDDAIKCRMCGRAVAVGRDGRCALGHFVGVPHPDAAPQPDDQRAHDEVPDEGVPQQPGVGDPGATSPAAEQATAALTAPAEPPSRPAASPEAGASSAPVTGQDLSSDLFAAFHEFDDVPEAGGEEDASVPGAAETVDLLADLGSELGGAPVAPRPTSSAPPRSAPPPPATPSVALDEHAAEAGFDDLLGWDAAASALDMELAGPDADATAAVTAEPRADDEAGPATAGEEEEDEDTLEAEDRLVARRRIIGVVGGTVAVTAALVGSVLVLPL